MSQKRKLSSMGIPELALAAASRRTSFVNRKDVSVSYRDPEFFSGSPQEIVDMWNNMRGQDDQLVNPDVQGAQIALGAFNIAMPVGVGIARQRLLGFKASVSGNQNINTAAKVDATARFSDNNNLNRDTKAQIKLKAYSVDYYHFFTKNISQVVQPAYFLLGNWIIDTVPLVTFQQIASYFGTGPDGLTVQIEPLNSRHPDVMDLYKQIGRVRRFLNMVQTKYKFLCDAENRDYDLIEFDENDIKMYDVDES